VVSANSSVAREGSSGHEGRTARLVAAIGVLVALTTLPGCITPKPPTPTLTGPDTGWTHTPTVFTETHASTGGWTTILLAKWGDSPDESRASGDHPSHEYADPGTYVVECRLVNIPWVEWGQLGGSRGGNWSNPCTVHIVPDTLTHPDSIYATVEFSHTPSWSCVLPNGSAVYVTNGDDSSVYVLDPSTNSITESIRVQSDPTCCVASAAGDRVYVSNHGGNSISAIRTADNSVVDTMPLPAPPDRLLLLPGDTLLYVSHAAANRVSVVRLSDDSIIASIVVRDSPCAMTCTQDGQYVYVAGVGNDTLTVINALNHTVEKSFRSGDRPASMLFSSGGETAYVACERAKQVLLYRSSDLARIDSIGFPAQHLLMLPGYRCLYGMSGGAVSIFRRSDNFLLRQLKLGSAGGPSALPDGSRIYVPNGNVVTVLGPGSK
jgi:YVTN family beta-propeller protein